MNKRLSKEDEIRLAKLIEIGKNSKNIIYKQRGNKAREILIDSNMALVGKYASEYTSDSLSREDLFQEGFFGLVKAVDKFDFRRGCRFSTYAVPWIKQSINRAIFRQDRNVKLPVHLLEKMNKLRKVMSELKTVCSGDPSLEDVSKKTSYSVDEIVKLLSLFSKTASINKKVGEDEGSELINFIEDKNAQNPESSYIVQETKYEISKALGSLLPKEKQVIEWRFGLKGNPKTFQEIGNYLGVSRERVRQIQVKALNKLKKSELKNCL